MMSGIPVSEFEVVGFDGAVAVECGRALPVARHRAENFFVRLAASGEVVLPSHRYSHAEILAYAEEGRLTLLPHPLPAVAGGVVLFVTEPLLHILQAKLPTEALGSPVRWTRFQAGPQGLAWAASLPAKLATRLVDEWGRVLAGKALDHLTRFVHLDDETALRDAEQAVDAGLAAAVDPDLRATLHERAGLVYLLADDPEGLADTYELFVSREFEGLTWDGYRARLSRLSDLVRLRPEPVPVSDSADREVGKGLLERAPAIPEGTQWLHLSEAEYRWLESLPLFRRCYAPAIQQDADGVLKLDPLLLSERLDSVSPVEVGRDPFAVALQQPAVALA